MIEPEDFGYGPMRTLAHVAAGAAEPRHAGLWREWQRELDRVRPRLRNATIEDADPLEPGATHIVPSVGGVRVGCRVIEPAERPRGAAVVLHGYEQPEALNEAADRWEGLIGRGCVVVLLRVRGYPGSTMDTGDLTRGEFGWIGSGLDPLAPTDEPLMHRWVYPRAIADVVLSCRAVGEAFGVPVSLAGESFGGGLAVAAAARGAGVSRLAFGLASMGDWAWRLEHRATRGLWLDVEHLLRHYRRWESEIVEGLLACDTATLARGVTCPALAKLALRDEVVPAPTAAAVYNALKTEPAGKCRFLVPAGHADIGLANARRHALFERMRTEFLDPAHEPARVFKEWEAVLNAGERDPGRGRAMSNEQGSLFGGTEPTGAGQRGVDEARLIDAYERAQRTLDDLPYTPEFARLCAEVGAQTQAQQRDAFRTLHRMRKAARLPRMGRSASERPRIEPEEESLLSGLIVEAVGTLGQRDRLPYSAEMDALVEKFNAQTGRSLDHHAVWRLIAKIAK